MPTRAFLGLSMVQNCFGVSSYRIITFGFWIMLYIRYLVQFWVCALVGGLVISQQLFSPNPTTVLVVLLFMVVVVVGLWQKIWLSKNCLLYSFIFLLCKNDGRKFTWILSTLQEGGKVELCLAQLSPESTTVILKLFKAYWAISGTGAWPKTKLEE